jgi:7-carboxy-7-deazaguanine synthase
MFIAETFVSLQGEGMLAGTPSFFIRTSGCNLRCRWCDTPYTSWAPEGERRVVEELVALAVASGARHVVVTGGEPLLQRSVGELTGGLCRAGLHVTVETAGTVDPRFDCDLLSVSPKTSNSDPPGAWAERHRRTRADLAPLRRLLVRFEDHQLKFVVRDSDDMPDILALVAELGDVDRQRVLLMPEGRTAAEVASRSSEVAALCIRHGFRYTPRLQLDLFGGGRGV